MMVKVKKRSVLLDEQDQEIFSSRAWHVSDTGYVVWRGVDTDGKKKTIRLHRDSKTSRSFTFYNKQVLGGVDLGWV